jgi:hypothetical protein
MAPVGVDLKSCFGTSLRQCFDEILPIHIRLEDMPLSIGPAHYMANIV